MQIYVVFLDADTFILLKRLKYVYLQHFFLFGMHPQTNRHNRIPGESRELRSLRTLKTLENLRTLESLRILETLLSIINLAIIKWQALAREGEGRRRCEFFRTLRVRAAQKYRMATAFGFGSSPSRVREARNDSHLLNFASRLGCMIIKAFFQEDS